MEVNAIIAGIDAQIKKLQEARRILEGVSATGPVQGARRRGRPKGNKSVATKAATTTRRKLSPEGRKRIADAMKRRWAERRKATKSTAASAK